MPWSNGVEKCWLDRMVTCLLMDLLGLFSVWEGEVKLFLSWLLSIGLGETNDDVIISLI